MKNVLDILYERGFIKQTVFEDDLKKLLSEKSVTFYAGFDPSADSLHVGHFIPVMAMMHMQRAGHRPIVLFGGGTGLIGDPSGKTEMRNLLEEDSVARNVEKLKIQLSRFFDTKGKNAAIFTNNGDWLKKLNYVDFLRDVGVYFSVNKMLTADCYKQRMEKGLNFLEFNYMLMQSYDFLMLYKRYGCVLEIGGNDQWSNILAGADLIRRKERADAYAVTLSLLETSDGTKMGKTVKGAVWLDAEKTTPYELYQYLRNAEDIKVEEYLKLLTFLPLDEIAALTAHRDERINEAKRRLAYEFTKIIHGEDAAKLADEQARGAFGGGDVMPSVTVKGGFDSLVADIMVLAGVADSKSEARRLIEGGGVKIGDNKVMSPVDIVGAYAKEPEFILNKGKKVRLKIILKAISET